jgi:hypothetical protein
MNIIIISIKKIKKKRFQLWRTFFEKGHFKNVQKAKMPFRMAKENSRKAVLLGDALKNEREKN